MGWFEPTQPPLEEHPDRGAEEDPEDTADHQRSHRTSEEAGERPAARPGPGAQRRADQDRAPATTHRPRPGPPASATRWGPATRSPRPHPRAARRRRRGVGSCDLGPVCDPIRPPESHQLQHDASAQRQLTVGRLEQHMDGMGAEPHAHQQTHHRQGRAAGRRTRARASSCADSTDMLRVRTDRERHPTEHRRGRSTHRLASSHAAATRPKASQPGPRRSSRRRPGHARRAGHLR